MCVLLSRLHVAPVIEALSWQVLLSEAEAHKGDQRDGLRKAVAEAAALRQGLEDAKIHAAAAEEEADRLRQV